MYKDQLEEDYELVAKAIQKYSVLVVVYRTNTLKVVAVLNNWISLDKRHSLQVLSVLIDPKPEESYKIPEDDHKERSEGNIVLISNDKIEEFLSESNEKIPIKFFFPSKNRSYILLEDYRARVHGGDCNVRFVDLYKDEKFFIKKFEKDFVIAAPHGDPYLMVEIKAPLLQVIF
ncbi:hypothetical protein RF11_00549 [Thelohanellus kitauei]|uniref:Uncharacterized protein n=1 Tax=Thelohanellus kitauei TaxID=669202 RepID=A0A0C2N3F3_THEKT|nr:hypothetical protein RF11_00549 [Thelohanellus kitauei]